MIVQFETPHYYRIFAESWDYCHRIMALFPKPSAEHCWGVCSHPYIPHLYAIYLSRYDPPGY